MWRVRKRAVNVKRRLMMMTSLMKMKARDLTFYGLTVIV